MQSERFSPRRLQGIGLSLFPCLISLVCLIVLFKQTHLGQSLSSWADSPKPQFMPDMDLWLIVPASFSVGLGAAFFSDAKRRLGAGLGGVLVAVLLCAMDVVLLWLSVLVPVGILLLAGWKTLRQEAKFDNGLVAAAFFSLVVVFALQMRSVLLVATLPTPLDPDAIMFLKLAETKSGFNTASREPLFLWMLQLMRLVSGSYSPTNLRIFSLLVSLATLGCLFAFTRRYIGLLGALTASMLYACNVPLAYTAIRGLREEIIIALFLFYAAAYISAWGKRPTLRSYSWMGVAATLMLFIRLNSGPFVILTVGVLFAFSAVKHRLAARQWWIALVPIALAYAPISPYLYYSWKNLGDPFYAVSMHTRFYANVELAGKHPDFPTKKEVEQNGYAGPKITMGEYLFKYHRPSEIVSRCFLGAGRLYFGNFVPLIEMDFRGVQQLSSRGVNSGKSFLYLVHLLGLVGMLFPGRRLFFALVFLFHAPAFFLASFEWFDWRLLTVAFASFYIGIGAAAQSGCLLAYRGLIAAPEEAALPVRRPRQDKHSHRKALKRS